MRSLLVIAILSVLFALPAAAVGNADYYCVRLGDGGAGSENGCLAWNETTNIVCFDADCSCDCDAAGDIDIGEIGGGGGTPLTCTEDEIMFWGGSSAPACDAFFKFDLPTSIVTHTDETDTTWTYQRYFGTIGGAEYNVNWIADTASNQYINPLIATDGEIFYQPCCTSGTNCEIPSGDSCPASAGMHIYGSLFVDGLENNDGNLNVTNDLTVGGVIYYDGGGAVTSQTTDGSGNTTFAAGADMTIAPSGGDTNVTGTLGISSVTTLSDDLIEDYEVGKTGGTGQGNGACAARYCQYTSASSNNDVTLPAAQVGLSVTIAHDATPSSTLDVFPESGDNLGAGVDTSISISQGEILSCHAIDSTNWDCYPNRWPCEDNEIPFATANGTVECSEFLYFTSQQLVVENSENPQLILAGDSSGSNDTDFQTDASGDLTIAPDGGDTDITGTLDVSGLITSTTKAVCLEDGTNCNIQGILNGTFMESFDATVTSDGATVTMSLEQSGGGDLTMQFSDGNTTLDCTSPVCTIALTAGSDASPGESFIYILQSGGVLVESTSDWPATEHIKIAYFLVPSAAYVQSDGPYVNQNWNDHISGTNNQGHLTHMAERSRRDGAYYFSGIDSAGTSDYLTISGSTVYFKSGAGVIYQMHKHTFPAHDTSGTDDVHVVNWSGDAYHDIQNLNDITADSTGTSTNNKWMNLVVWGVANKTGEYEPLMINLPSCTYVTQSTAEQDASGCDSFAIPREFSLESSTGFLIARITVKDSATWSYGSYVDLRGQTPVTATGGAVGFSSDFADNIFTIFDDSDITKVATFQASVISSATTREYTFPDASGVLALVPAVGSIANYSQSFTTQTSILVEHDLGTSNVLALCYDSNDKLIVPDDVTIGGGDPWDITVTFTTAQTGRCVVNGAGAQGATGATGPTGPTGATDNYSQTFTTQTSVSLTHALGTSNVVWDCYDSNDKWILPEDVTIGASDPWAIAVTFDTAQTGRCVVNGAGNGIPGITAAGSNYSQAFTTQTSVSLTHQIGTQNVMFMCYDGNDKLIMPDTATIGAADPWDIAITFTSAQTGRCVVNGFGETRYAEGFTTQTSVTMAGTEHGLNTSSLTVGCYDDSSPRERVEPNKVTIDDTSYDVVVTFFVAETGRCVVQ